MSDEEIDWIKVHLSSEHMHGENDSCVCMCDQCFSTEKKRCICRRCKCGGS